MSIKQPALSTIGWVIILWVFMLLVGLPVGMNGLFIAAVIGSLLMLFG